MGLFAKAFLAATAVASVSAIDISVKSDGGNQTGKFGHEYGYGFLHEASPLEVYRLIVANKPRISITPVTVVSMPS